MMLLIQQNEAKQQASQQMLGMQPQAQQQHQPPQHQFSLARFGAAMQPRPPAEPRPSFPSAHLTTNHANEGHDGGAARVTVEDIHNLLMQAEYGKGEWAAVRKSTLVNVSGGHGEGRERI
jgi:hypothetical protein